MDSEAAAGLDSGRKRLQYQKFDLKRTTEVHSSSVSQLTFNKVALDPANAKRQDDRWFLNGPSGGVRSQSQLRHSEAKPETYKDIRNRVLWKINLP